MVVVLDTIVWPRLEGMPEVLAAWLTTKRPGEPGGSAAVTGDADAVPLAKVA